MSSNNQPSLPSLLLALIARNGMSNQGQEIHLLQQQQQQHYAASMRQAQMRSQSINTAPGNSTAAADKCEFLHCPQHQQEQKNCNNISEPSQSLKSTGLDHEQCVVGTNLNLSVKDIILQSKASREAILNRGSRVIPCRARSMPMDHSSNTAFFEVENDASHGAELVCSFPACRNGGIKFVWCKYCEVPVSKRSFKSQHSHVDLRESNVLSRGFPAGDAVNLQKDSSSRKHAREDSAQSSNDVEKRIKFIPNKLKAPNESGDLKRSHFPVGASNQLLPLAEAAAAVAPFVQAAVAGHDVDIPYGVTLHNRHNIPSGSSDTSSSASVEDRLSSAGGTLCAANTSQGNSKMPVGTAPSESASSLSNGSDESGSKWYSSGVLEQWKGLLEDRPSLSSAADMTSWLLRVLSTSDLAAQEKRSRLIDDSEDPLPK